jgi:hypothetical protein
MSPSGDNRPACCKIPLGLDIAGDINPAAFGPVRLAGILVSDLFLTDNDVRLLLNTL